MNYHEMLTYFKIQKSRAVRFATHAPARSAGEQIGSAGEENQGSLWD
jgi:hypothetical protein